MDTQEIRQKLKSSVDMVHVRIHLCAITSGGSQAMFFKVNTWGEETFLDTLKDVIR